MNDWNGFGRICSDIDLRYIPGNGTAVAKFTVAIDRKLSKAKKEEMKAAGKQTSDFIRCQAWGKTAELVANKLDKGCRVAINGNIETGSYKDKDGKTVYTTEIRVGSLDIIDWASENEKKDEFKELSEEESAGIPF